MPVIKDDGSIHRGPELKILPKTDGKRRCSDWLGAFLDHTSELESPAEYLRWAGLSTIAAVAQRKIVREAQAYVVYPNMYVWLVGPPGTKKSTSIRAGWRLLNPGGQPLPGVYMSSTAPSVVGLMKDFDDIASIQKDHQSLNAFIWELSSLFENATETMAGFLTAIYDGDAGYKKRSREGGLEQIPYPWFNMVAGTTPSWLGDNLTKNTIEGGMLARVLPVFSDQLSFDSPEPLADPDYLRRESMLTHDLAHILQIQGTFEWEGGRVPHGNREPCHSGCGCGDAYKWYDKWYRDRSRIPRIPDNRTQHYYVRKPLHLLKVAMLLSLARRDTKVYQVEDLVTALALLESIESGMKRSYSAVGGNPYATDLERIHQQIKYAKRLSRAEIIAANYHNIEQQKMDQALVSLEQLAYIKKVIGPEGIFYEILDPLEIG